MKIKLILLLVFTCILSIGAEAESFEIPMDNIKVVSADNVVEEKVDIETENKSNKIVQLGSSDSDFGNTNSGNTIDISKMQEIKERVKLKLKNYSNVHYVKGYDWFSIHKPNEDSYDFYLNKIGVNKIEAENLIGYADTPKEIITSALYYDLIEHKPNIAENFYLIFKKTFQYSSFFSKEILADYLIRTGRYQKNELFLKKINCFHIAFKYKSECLYYYGVANFLNTGNSKNFGIRFSKNKIKQAKIIYNRRAR